MSRALVSARPRARTRAIRSKSRGFTLLEVLVSVAILAMIAILIYGAFDSMSRGKKGEEMKAERARTGRSAILRMTRELQSAYLSLHTPTNPSLVVRQTLFSSQNSPTFDRVDFTSFAHRRIRADVPESDQAEIGYFVVSNPDNDKMDLVRREQTPIDLDAKRGGQTNVMAEDVESFQLRFFDPLSWQWIETWDSLQAASGQPNRIPYEIEITLVLAHCPPGVDPKFQTKFQLPIQQPLSFGIPR